MKNKRRSNAQRVPFALLLQLFSKRSWTAEEHAHTRVGMSLGNDLKDRRPARPSPVGQGPQLGERVMTVAVVVAVEAAFEPEISNVVLAVRAG